MGPPVRTATAARVVLGTLCLAAPDRVLVAVGGRASRTNTIVRVLGGRMVLQAGLDVALRARSRRLDVAVELAHAASMLPVSMIWPAHRRPALVSAAAATGIVLLDLIGLQRRPRGAPRGCVSAGREWSQIGTDRAAVDDHRRIHYPGAGFHPSSPSDSTGS